MNLKRFNKIDRLTREVVTRASAAFALKVLAGTFMFLLNIVLARLLDPSSLGLYFLALTVMTIGASIGKMGLPNALIQHTAANASAGDWKAVKGVYRQGILLGAAVSTLVALLICGLGSIGARYLFSNPELTAPLRWMSLALVPFALSFLFAQLLKGLQRPVEGLLVESVMIPGLCIAFAFLLIPRWGLAGAVWGYTAACVLTTLCGYYFWKRANPGLKRIEADFDRRVLLRSSMPLFWMVCLQMITTWASTLMLGIWRPSAEVGVFGLANRMAGLTSLVLIAVNSIVAPKFAAFHRQGDLRALERLARQSATLIAAFAGPMLLAMLIAPSWLMGIYGDAYRVGGGALAILAAGQFVNAVTGAVGCVLLMSGRETTMRNIVAVCAVANLTLNVLLIPRWGVAGAAVATAVGVGIQNIIAVFAVKRLLGISTLPALRVGAGIPGAESSR